MKNLTPEQQALIVKIDEQMRDALKGYVSDPLTPEKMGLIKKEVESILDTIAENRDKFTDHVNFILDPYDLDHNMLHFHMVPHVNAPKWVYEVFEQLNEYSCRSNDSGEVAPI